MTTRLLSMVSGFWFLVSGSSKLRAIFGSLAGITIGHLFLSGFWFPVSGSLLAATRPPAWDGDSYLPDPTGVSPLLWVAAGLIALVFIIGGIFAAIIGGMTIVEKLKGRKAERLSGHIENDPLKIGVEDPVVKRNELTVRLTGLVDRKELHDTEVRLEGRIEERFVRLDGQRRSDIQGVHQKIEERVDTLRAEMADSGKETRKEITDLPGKLVDLLQKTGAIGGKK